MAFEAVTDIRKLGKGDGAALLDLLLKLDNETKFMLMEPGERVATPEDMERRLDAKADQSAYFGAYSGDLIGFVYITRGAANRTKHSAYIVMGILSAHGGKGLGGLLLARAQDWAKQHGITRLELTVMVNNTNAVKLYEKVGFVKEGVKRRSCLVDGEYVDEFYMGKLI